MFTPDHHLNDKTLRLFAVGVLTEKQGDEIEAHLAGCEACSRRLDEIERRNSDPFLREMKAAGNVATRNENGEPSDDFASNQRIGNFRLEKRLGRGGMGEAWKAFDTAANRYVVLKFVPKDVQHFSEAIDTVLDSFQKVHALQHQHICPSLVLDNDPEHGFFLVMKYIEGLSLDVYSRKHGPLPFDEVIQILRGVAEALDYAHEKKVIHRDVKPANIMLGETDGVQLIDFGLADEIRQSLTRTTDISAQKITGTRSYMAPEQWEGRKQDSRTDQYALAVTAYELLSGHVPFAGTDTEVLKNAVLHNMPAPIPELSGPVNAALFKGLAKRREERFNSCMAFIEALSNPFKIQTESPRLRPPLPPPYVKSRTVRWKWIVSTILVVLVLVFSLAIFAVFQPLGAPPSKNDLGNDDPVDYRFTADDLKRMEDELINRLEEERIKKISSEYIAMFAPGKRYVTDWIHEGESGKLAMQFDAYSSYDSETDQMEGVFFDPLEPDKTYAFQGWFDKTLKSDPPVFLAHSHKDFIDKLPKRTPPINAPQPISETDAIALSLDLKAVTPTQRFFSASMCAPPQPPSYPPLSADEIGELMGTRLIKENGVFIRIKKSQNDHIEWRMQPLSEESYQKMRESYYARLKEKEDLLEKARIDRIKQLIKSGTDYLAKWTMNGESGQLGMKIIRFDELKQTFDGRFYNPEYPNDPLYEREFSGTFSLTQSESEKPYSIRMHQKSIDPVKRKEINGTINDIFFPSEENGEIIWKFGIANGKLIFDEPNYDNGLDRKESLKLIFEPAVSKKKSSGW